MSVVIKVENLYKQYRLGEVSTGTMAHDLNRWWHKVRGKEDPYMRVTDMNQRDQLGDTDYVWALQDINFEVKQGEVLGIIGRNGAGKSTLLKILSKVTAPTKGEVKVKGRIASLLEVGTGFHPELTGRDNIFLNGAILGMTKKEIQNKFDEIVDFSGCERYIDTPVKRYSSGMYVRLAFAVAAHLEPEILIVDEVLAVGDAEFQKKCLGKMKDVAGEGRTVLFVSHNIGAVQTLCENSILLDSGKSHIKENSKLVIQKYLNNQQISHFKFQEAISLEELTLNWVEISNNNKINKSSLCESQPIKITSNLIIKDINPERYSLTYHIHNQYDEPIFSIIGNSIKLQHGENTIECLIPEYFLQPNNYKLSLYIVYDNWYAKLHRANIIAFTVKQFQKKIGDYLGEEPGYIRPKFKWNLLSQ